MKLTRLPFFTVLLFFLSVCAFSQSIKWSIPVNKKEYSDEQLMPRGSYPKLYELFQTDFTFLKNELLKAPQEEQAQLTDGLQVELPAVSGKPEVFYVFYAPVMAPELAEKYPELRSYKAVNAKDPSNIIHISVSPEFGMHFIGYNNKGQTYYVDTYTRDLNTYILYNRNDISNSSLFECLVPGNESSNTTDPAYNVAQRIDDNKYRTYRLAMACTTEYASFHINAANLNNGTLQQKKQAVLAAMNVTVTRLNSVYERDVAAKLVLVANNDQIIFVDQDNFSNGSPGQLINQSQSVITSTIGTANFDIGHTVSTGAGGLAILGSLCIPSEKARGITGTSNPVGDPFDIDYVAHEIGHQFGANHTFNATTGSCGGGNRNLPTAMEPGSGSTIMGYASLCGMNNVQNHSDAYFHTISLQEMAAHIQSTNCGTIINANNAAPSVNAGAGYTIPNATPFVLTASATDSNNANSLTYTWEQTDNNTSTQPPVATSTGGPLFRSIVPSDSPSRSFPSYQTVLSGTSLNNGIVGSTWERLPSVARNLNFTVTVRDNNIINGGQTKHANTLVKVANTGPFVITYPNNVTNQQNNWTIQWASGEQKTITWNVAGTTGNGINTANVKISYSLDDGATFTPFVEETPNDGSEEVTLPVLAETNPNVRIKIEAVGNIFYTVSKKVTIYGENAADEQFELTDFKLYPNPASEFFTVEFTSTTNQEITFQLFDYSGRQVFYDRIPNNGTVYKSIATHTLASGVYILNIKDGNQKISKKIVKK